MFEVGAVAQFEAAHRLKGDFGPATRLHGHTYRVEIAARGESLRDDGTLCDLAMLQRVVQEAVADLHYRDLDELDQFRDRNTTAEVVAGHLFQRIAPAMAGQGITVLSVRLWESPQAYASYEGPVPSN